MACVVCEGKYKLYAFSKNCDWQTLHLEESEIVRLIFAIVIVLDQNVKNL